MALLLSDLKLGEDEEELLIALCESAGWEVFVKTARKIQRDAEDRVLKYNLEAKGQDGLAYLLSEAKGARMLLEKLIEIGKDARGQ